MKLRNINKAKVRKYDDGVAKQKLDYGAIASGIGTLGTMAIDVATMDNPAPSKAATAGKGALSGMATGASMGAAGGPIGTAIGAGVGLLAGGALGLWQGGKEEDAYKAEQKKKEELANTQRTMAFNQSSQSNLASANNRGFTSSGTQQSSFYGKDGGRLKMLADGGIHIKPSHKGLFTAKANKAGEGVQEYASHVMANKEDFSPATVKQANFARNASHWKHGDGGKLVPNKSEMTKLSEGQETAYQNWMNKNKYNESGDYDYRGYYKKEGFKNLGSPKGGEHFTDEFKRLSPFEGDNYMQLSDESNKASEFDKRRQGTWIDNKFVAYKQGGIIKKDGGELQPVSKNTQLAVGQSHENGGIKLDSKSEIEGGETLVDKGDHTLVVSDNLVNPLSGNTFAKDDLKLAKSLSKYEGKTSNLAKNSVKQINAKREILHSMQQKMNGNATDEEQGEQQPDNEALETQNMAENGMKLNKVGVAGQGPTSEDITYKADIPIAGRPSPIRYAPKEVKKLNMLSKPVQYPVPLRPQAPNYAENGIKMYGKGGVNSTIPFPKTPITYLDSLEYEGINRLNFENTKGAPGGKQGVGNYGFTHTKWKSLYPNINFSDPEQALAVHDKEMAYPNSFKGKMRNQLTDYMFHSNRDVNHLMLLADSKNTGVTLDDVNSNSPVIAKKLKDAWVQHGPRLSTLGNDKTFNDNLASARKQLQATNPLGKKGQGRGTLTNPHPNSPAWYERTDDMANLNYSKGESKTKTPATSTPMTKGNMKTHTSGGRTYTGGSGKLYNINNKGERFIKEPNGDWKKTDKFVDSVEKQFNVSNNNTSTNTARIIPSYKGKEFVSTTNNSTGNDPLGESTYTAPVDMVDRKKARLAKEEPKDYTSLNKGLGSLAKLSSYVAPHIMDWANENKNIAKLKAINTPDAPQQGFANLAKQNREVDRAEIKKQQGDYNASLSGTLADSQTAALMKANMSEKAAGAISGVNQNQRNANSQISNAQTEMNMGIDARNKAGIYGQKQQQMEKDVDISNRQSSNTSNLLSGFRDVQNTYRQEGYADKKFDIDYAGLNERGRAYMDKLKATGRGYWNNEGTSLYKRNGGKLSKLAK